MSASAASSSPSQSAARPWWQVGLIAAALAALGNLVVYVLAEGVFGQDLRVPNQQTGELIDLGPGPVVLFTVVPALLATLLAAWLARRAAAPRRIFLVISLIVLLLSFLTPILADLIGGTKITLALMHVVAAVGIVWPLSARLPVDAR